MSEEQGQVSSHSHDEMYLIWHHLGHSGGPDYFSCHHCGFIKVPDLDKLKSLAVELVDAIKSSQDHHCPDCKRIFPLSAREQEVIAKAREMGL
jgi:hypothetical protein